MGVTGTADLATQALNLRMTAVLSKAFTDKLGGAASIGGFMNTALANNQGELVIPATVTGTGQNPKFAPDLKQIGQMKLKGLLPNSNNPSSAVSGILGGMLGQKGPASTPTATATAATESGRANHQHFREEKTAAAGTPAPAEMMRLAAYCLISKHTNRNDLSNQDILAL
ncbi:MAG: hypothetical protein DMG26_07150 [Acidobacteria bacterium]|nr:MAG: hypothetical protein DMG26_07150 [Acidobacteriota bacterium]